MLLRVLALAAPLTMIAGCTNAVEVAPTAASSVLTSASSWTLYQGSPSPSPAGSWPAGTVAAGTFLPFRPGSTAITYDPAVVPPGASATVSIAENPRGMDVRVQAAGLIPRRAYGAHLHTAPCTAVPDDAGPHYQHRADPSKPSVDPSYANPRNEVWLDFTADGYGTATASSALGWTFAADRPARSLVLHAQATRTGPGVAGTAGPRVACLTLPAR
ncbi:hypothetical protein [Actinoplanes sp. URMC 104]|uniref:hypothetical protein n=1 Tax=Actinoplanes sp. URMC 104 TaxID=3423409 RepID=UPI003F19E983